MEMFAKLFESHGRQILVTKGEDTDGNPQLQIHMRFDGAGMTIGPCFTDDDAGDAALDHAFDSFGQEEADGFGKLLVGVSSAFEAATRLTRRGAH